MEKRYLLSITLLLASTDGVHQELCFQTQLPPLRISKEACVVHLRVRNGTALSCEIKGATGSAILFQNEQAIEVLNTLGMLEWYRVPSPAYQAEAPYEQGSVSWQNGSPPQPTGELIPVRQRLNGEIPILDHAHRRVLMLVDGTRNNHQIAKLLVKSPEEVSDILRTLQGQNLITFLR